MTRRLILILAAASIAMAQKQELGADFAGRLAALEQSRIAHPGDLALLDTLAGSYAMAAEYRKSIAVLQHMRALRPEDSAIELRLARNYAWAGDTSKAIVEYNEYLRRVPFDRQATIELIRLRRYRGDYSQAEQLCNRLLLQNPDDAEVLAMKAEALHWGGHRGREARRIADRAAAIAPASADAKVSQIYASLDLGEKRRALDEFASLRDQIERAGGVHAEASYRDAYRLLETVLARPAALRVEPAFAAYNDSDGVHDSVWSWNLAHNISPDHQLLFDGNQYTSSAPLGSPFADSRDHGYLGTFRAGGQATVAPGLFVTLLGGGSYRRSDGALRPVFDFRVAASPVDRWTFELSTGREFLSVTPRAIERGTANTSVAGSAQYAFDSRTSASIRVVRRYWSDANRSTDAEANLRRIVRYSRRLSVDTGLLNLQEQFDRDTQLAAGFFTPDRYRRHDGFLGIHGELRGLRYEARGSGGAQQVSRVADYRPDWDFSSAVSVGIGKALQLSASYQRRNYSLVSKDGWYQGFYFGLGIRQ